MKRAYFFSTLLASSIAFGATPIDGWYSSVFGGITYVPDYIHIERDLLLDKSKFNWGYNAGGRVGCKSAPFRYEGELNWIQATTKQFHANQIHQHDHIQGESDAVAFLANVYYDFPDIVPSIEPFVSAGIGMAWVREELSSRSPFFGRIHFSDASTAFAYELSAGLNYNFAENYAVNIAYRYISTTKIHAVGKIYQPSSASVGVIYRWNEANYK